MHQYQGGARKSPARSHPSRSTDATDSADSSTNTPEQHDGRIYVPHGVISPHAKKGPIETSLPCDHTSTVKLLETLHGLPTLASQNHLFDTGTPTGSNYQTGGASAPP